ncbi:MAG: glycosyltransferase family 4 protein [Variibacter sp.]|nr:glycosyltransferase family 4 protein [Variibacter sp.]
MPAPTLLSINNYFYPRGGAEVVFLEHNRMFQDLGWEVVPFAMRHPRNLATRWESFFPDESEFGVNYGVLGNAVRAQRAIYSLQARRNLRRLLARARPRLAHAHNVYHHLSPSILPALKAAGVPVVLTVHDLKLTCPARTMMRDGRHCEDCRGGHFRQVLEHRCIKQSVAASALVMLEGYVHRWLRLYAANVERFVVPSRFLRDTMVRWGWPQERVLHIPNFVELDRFEPRGPIGERFVYCGRIDASKGVLTLVAAAARARQPLTLVGTGPDEARCRELAARAGADVRFAGFASGPALAALLESARAVVVPSEIYENAPLAILEAYAAGRPVIGARSGGIPELVREGETGTLFESGSVDELAAALARFGAAPAGDLADMGRAGRQWVEREFCAGAYRDRMLALYASVTERAA